jgi:hypothetical protein
MVDPVALAMIFLLLLWLVEELTKACVQRGKDV